MERALLIALLLLGGCSGGEEEGSGPPPDTNQIERLSTPDVNEVDPNASARLEPLMADDLATLEIDGPICSFRSEGLLLLAATPSDTVVKLEGRILHPLQSSPIGPSGGFFEDRSLSISIGRIEAGGASPKQASGPARMTVTNRRSEAQLDLSGVWSCGI